MAASISMTLPVGTYFAKVSGVGFGSAVSTGYSDYASLGRHDLTVTTNTPSGPTPPLASLTPATVGMPYSARFVTHDGTAPLTYSVSGGTLPGGLALAKDGTLTGSPTAPGTFPFRVQVTDARSLSATAGFTLVVQPAPADPPATTAPDPVVTPVPEPVQPAPTATPEPAPAVHILTAPTLRKARVGRPYSVRLRGENVVAWQRVQGAWPRGMRLRPDGTLTGRPRAAGRYSATVQATGTAGHSDVAVFTITVRRAKR